METTEERMDIVMKGPPENDFVNFQLGEFMFSVGVDTLFDFRGFEKRYCRAVSCNLTTSCNWNLD